jgi:hypothetical protein
MPDNLYLSNSETTIYISKTFNYHNSFFRIIQIEKIDEVVSYNIENIDKIYDLTVLENRTLIFDRKKYKKSLWNFNKMNNNKYVIKNRDNCYILVHKLKVYCERIPPNNATKFKITRIFYEVEEKKLINFQLIDKEPIDILIKYIDLRDPNLQRSGIHQIEKDYDNEELKYSLRSILKNIPWIRKIFILMPNEKVRYFKEINLINEKIIYIKDKDLLGYDSSNPRAFQFRYWKMKQFNISNNIIIMDDDYFIGRKLEKTDFFHVENGKVVPSIITSNFLEINKVSVMKNRKLYEERMKVNQKEQNIDVFNYCKYSTFLFILNLFNKSLYENVYII